MSNKKTCNWCGETTDDEHRDLKLVISEMTHNWGLERKVFVRRIATLTALNEQCKSSLAYNVNALSKANIKIIDLEGLEKS